MKKTLVTGANGYIGSHLVDALLEKTTDSGEPKYSVRGLVLPGTPEDNLENAKKNPRFEIAYGNLLEPDSLGEATKDVDVIFHLAALVADWGPKKKFMAVIYEGTKSLATAAIKNGVRRFVYMSSLAIHKMTGHVDADESTPRDEEKNPYALTKRLAEDFLVELHNKGELETILVRPGWVIYGPRDMMSFYQMADNIERGNFGFINGGTKLINHVFVKNLVKGMIFLSEQPAGSVSGEAFIIAEGSHTWKEYINAICERIEAKTPKLNVKFGVIAPFIWLLEKLYKLFRVKHPPILNMYRISIPRRDIDFSSKKILDLGFQFPYQYEEGMDETCRWYIEQKGENEQKFAERK